MRRVEVADLLDAVWTEIDRLCSSFSDEEWGLPTAMPPADADPDISWGQRRQSTPIRPSETGVGDARTLLYTGFPTVERTEYKDDIEHQKYPLCHAR